MDMAQAMGMRDEAFSVIGFIPSSDLELVARCLSPATLASVADMFTTTGALERAAMLLASCPLHDATNRLAAGALLAAFQRTAASPNFPGAPSSTIAGPDCDRAAVLICPMAVLAACSTGDERLLLLSLQVRNDLWRKLFISLILNFFNASLISCTLCSVVFTSCLKMTIV